MLAAQGGLAGLFLRLDLEGADLSDGGFCTCDGGGAAVVSSG